MDALPAAKEDETMKDLKLQFSDEEARRLERAAKAGKADSLTAFARAAVLDRIIYSERDKAGHYPQRPHPSAFRRERESL